MFNVFGSEGSPILPRSASLPGECKHCGKGPAKGARQLCDAWLDGHRAEAVEFIKDAGLCRLQEI